jgi:shikimate 5-dehydrogenase
MFRPLSQLLASSVVRRRTRGLGVVLGAGGTARAACYTVKQLGKLSEHAFVLHSSLILVLVLLAGLDLVVINRNVTKAEELAER